MFACASTAFGPDGCNGTDSADDSLLGEAHIPCLPESAEKGWEVLAEAQAKSGLAETDEGVEPRLSSCEPTDSRRT